MRRVGALLAQRARRDWLQVVLWASGTALLAYASYAGVAGTYGTEQDRTSLLAAALANPVILLFRGLPSGTDEGAFMIFLIFPWLALLAGFMSTFLAVRHTRGDEESGRSELVAATPAARTLPIVATIVHGVLANALLAVLIAAAFLAVGLGPAGAALAGVGVAAVGITFLGIALVTAQLLRTSRAANAAAVWTMLAAFVVAGVGNAIGTPSDDLTRMESSWVAWLSPFGWAENTRAFDENEWWPAMLCLAVGVALAVVATVLASARDLGGSFIAERPGSVSASPALSTSAGLVWRLTRPAVIGWAAGGFITGLLSTSLASIVEDIGAANPAVEEVLAQISGGGGAEQATVTTFFTMLGVIAACCAVQIVCRARQEEAHGTAEPLLALPVGRMRWLADYCAVAFGGVVLVVGAAIAGAVLGIAVQGGDAGLLRDALVAGAGQIAAASVFLALTALAFAALPRTTIALGWSLVLVAMTLGLFGPLFQLPEALVHLSPIAVTPYVDGDDVDIRGLWWLVAATAAGVAAALGLMRRRELTAAG
jgi:ABC-2 type transport system permease protein